jgi:ATP-dependent DNA helicase DinG
VTEEGIADLLAKVASLLPGGGEQRAGQVAMAEAVGRAIGTGRHLVVQAGTGTGKSLAYLVPAVASGRKVVVATATKALQDQLADKDLPMLAEALGRPFSFAVLKGRSNYLCRQRAAEVAEGGLQTSLVAGEGSEERAVAAPERLADQVRELLAWSETTATGDRAHLDFEPQDRAWDLLSVGPRECPGAFRCPSGPRCFAEEARAAAAEADVVVVNTHLYGTHLASGGAVLPPHDVVVFDEAHEVESVMTASLGVELAPGRFRALVNLARPLLPREAAETTLEGLLAVADRLRDDLSGRIGTRVLGPLPTPARSARPAAARSTTDPVERERSLPEPGRPGADPAPLPHPDDAELAATLDLATTRLERVSTLLEAGEAPNGDEVRRARALNAAGRLAEDLARLAARTDDEVAWVDGLARAPVLRLSPIDVGPALAAGLWGQLTAVMTSATVPVGLARSVGLDGFDVEQLDVGSPFDYRRNSMLYVARHLPDRRRPEAEAALHDELAALVDAAGGRTLALFTSRRATEAAVAALRPRLGYRLLAQGELPKARLLEQFTEDETSCLFATLGFWQGVDVPGRALSLVTLDRLPFSRPDDPLLQARRDRVGEAAFRLIDLPRAATLLAQGAGRLIRAAADQGVVAVLDPRLATAGYRATLLAALPPMRRTVDRHQVEEFLRRALTPTAPEAVQ